MALLYCISFICVLTLLFALAIRKNTKRNQFLRTALYEQEKINKKLLAQIESKNILNQELNLRIEELSSFAGVVAHDFKTPIRTTISFIQLIKNHIQQDDRISKYVSIIEKSNQRLGMLIDNLLEYTRSGHNAEHNKMLDLVAIFDIVKRNLTFQIQENSAEISVQQLPTLHANETEIIQLFQNIIENAIKYNVNRPPIILIDSKVDSVYYAVIIKDNGIGIRKEYLSRIFNPLARLHSVGEFEGTGLGLAICKKIVENLGGIIEVESIIDVGSTFTIKFPINLAETSYKRIVGRGQ